LGNDGDRGPIEPELLNDPQRSDDVAPATLEPSPFLLQTVAQIVDKGVKLSKVAGWPGPAVEGVFSEEEWQVSVTNYSAIVIQKRWPTLADQATPEVALLVLLLPWAIWAVPQLVKLVFKRRETGKSDSDPRSNGDGKDNHDAPAAEPMPAGLPH